MSLSSPFRLPVRSASLRLLTIALLTLVSLVILSGAGFAATPVTSGADDGGPGTLRSIITAAMPGDTITIPANISPITLDPTKTEILLNKQITIIGPGAGALTITANNAYRVFHISGAAVAITDVTISQGSITGDNGGDILVDSGGGLTLTTCVVSSGNAAKSGSAGGSGGGLAVAANSTANLTDCTFSGNFAAASGGGIFNAGTTTLTTPVITGNTAGTSSVPATGGGVQNASRLTVTGGSVKTNKVFGNGAGIESDSGVLKLSGLTLSGNTATGGGGGLGTAGGTVSVLTSTLSGNTAQVGGGVYLSAGGSATCTNDTISDNTATTRGGGIYNLGAISLTNDTVAANKAQVNSGGIYSGSSSTTLRGTIVATNTAAGNSPDFTGAAQSLGSNLFGNATGASGSAGAHDQSGTSTSPVNPLLGALQNNGGATLTRAIASTSPALNGDYASNPPATDQRGIARPIGIRADIGAYEAPSPPSAPTNLVATPGNTQITLTWTTTDATSYNVYRGTTAGGEAVTAVAANVPGPRYTDYGLTNGVKYFYVVRSVNAAGTSSASNEASAIPADTRVRGSVLAWGDNQGGELGTGDYIGSENPVAVAAPTGTTAVLKNVVAVSGGTRFSLALTATGTVYAWGDDTYGQLGDGNGGSFGNGSSNTSTTPSPVLSNFGNTLTGIIAISAGQDHALALASDGTVYAWGRNQYGQLGQGSSGSFTSLATAVRAPANATGTLLTGIIGIAVGGYHSLALRADGTVYAWGYNSSGQLGNATSGAGTDSSRPVAVFAPATASTTLLTNITAVAAGQYHSLALAADGSIYAWGYNSDGELGNFFGSSADSSVPVQVISFGVATAIAAGQYHSLALTTGGAVYAWGSDSNGQLGDGNSNSASSDPIAAITSGAVAIGAGASHSLAVRSDHALLTWGANASGQLGIGTLADSSVPTPTLTAAGSALGSIYAATGGSIHSLALQNLPPVAVHDTYTIGPAGRTVTAAQGLLANDYDFEGDGPLTAVLVKAPAHGTLTLNSNGSFTYVPFTNYAGVDSFNYKVNDGLADSTPATVSLTITNPALISITVTPANKTVSEGQSVAYTATGSYADSSTGDLTNLVTWTSSAPTVAAISNTAGSQGVATTATVAGSTATSPGTTTIKAVKGNVSSTATLIVVRKLKSFTITPASATVPQGQPQQYTATATYTDGTTGNITTQTAFQSSNTTIAQFNSPSLASTYSPGTVTITATSGGVTATNTATLKVGPVALQTIVITPASVTLSKGGSRQYTATANYSNGTTQDLTQVVTWNTTNPNVVTIDADGVASAIGVGTTTITAFDPGSKISGSTGVIVNDPNTVPKQHILWNLTNGQVSLWDVDTAGRYVEYLYGPFAGWTAASISTGPDGKSHILWNKADHTVSLWKIDQSGNQTNVVYGPYKDGPNNFWMATALSTGPDNVTHILWNNTDGKVSLWNVQPNGTVSSFLYGPYAGWTATALATGPDNVSHILWNNTNGKVSLWAVPTDGTFTSVTFPASAGYSAVSLSIGTDGTAHILWDKTNGAISFWNVSITGGITHTEYGPYSGWTAKGCSTDPLNVSHILWGNTNGSAAVWSVDSTTGNFNYQLYGPLVNYKPTGLSSGP